ncbi:hypothetical protein BGZ76_003867 [Entomortierella beljakovae]|nr:hypothetical protein BGZ76_003867 [Entomortierella beljakovae]
MLSAVSRQTLRVSRPCRVQSFNSLRHYASEGNSNDNNNSNKSDGDSTESDSAAILDIISDKGSQAKTKTNFSKDGSAKLILDTLTRVTDRHQQSSFRQSSLVSGLSSGRQLLSEPQTCTHNLHIHASMNNTILTLTDSRGDPIVQQSAGTAGFKKSARSGPEAGYQAMIKMVEKVEEKNIQIHTLHVLMKGFGPGRDSAFKAIRAKTNWDIKRITDTTPIPFNGCRPPKPRRL